MTAYRRSGDSGHAVPAPSENIAANFFRAERDGDLASFPTARENTTPACPNKRKKPRSRGIPDRAKKYNLCGLSKGGGRRLYGKEKPFSGGKNAEKFRLFTEFFVDASGNGVMTFEQVGGAGEPFVGRKKSAGRDGGGGGGICAAGCGLILWIGGRSRVNVFVVGGG